MGTHWRSFTDKNYLGNEDLSHDKDTIVKIKEIVKGELRGKTRDKEHKPVITLEGIDKKFIANATNCKTIEGMYGPFIEGWRGKFIALYVALVNTPDGDMPAVRVRPTIPRLKKGKAA